MNSVLKNVCKLKVPLKIVEHSCTSSTLQKTESSAVDFLQSNTRQYATVTQHEKEQHSSNLYIRPKLSCIFRRNLARKPTSAELKRSAACEEKEKKRDEVAEEECRNTKNDKKEKKFSKEKGVKFTVGLTDLINSFSRKNDLIRLHGANKINTFLFKPVVCRACNKARRKLYKNTKKYDQKRFFSSGTKRCYNTKYLDKRTTLKSTRNNKLSNRKYKKQQGRFRSDRNEENTIPLCSVLEQKSNKDESYKNATSLDYIKEDGQSPGVVSKELQVVSKQHIDRDRSFKSLTEILIPLFRRDHNRYLEFRKAFARLQSEFNIYLRHLRETKVFHEKSSRLKPLNEKGAPNKCVDNAEEDRSCCYNDHSTKSRSYTNISVPRPIENHNTMDVSSIFKYPMVSLRHKRQQPLEFNRVISKSSLSACTPSEGALISKRTYTSDTNNAEDSESTIPPEPIRKQCVRDADCFEYFQIKETSPKAPATHKLVEQFAIPQTEESHPFSSPPQTSTIEQKTNVYNPVREQSLVSTRTVNVDHPVRDQTLVSSRTVNVDHPVREQSLVSEDQQRLEAVKKLATQPFDTTESLLPFVDKVIEKKTPKVENDPTKSWIDDLNKTPRVQNEPKVFIDELNKADQRAVKHVRSDHNIERKNTFSKDSWKPTKVNKGANVTSRAQKNMDESQESSINKPTSLLDNCRGLFSDIMKKIQGPSKRNLGGSTFTSCDIDSCCSALDTIRQVDYTRGFVRKVADDLKKKPNKMVTLKTKRKYPWNRFKVYDNVSSTKKLPNRMLSQTARQQTFHQKDYSSGTTLKTNQIKNFRDKYPWDFTVITEENYNSCYLTKISYCNPNNIDSSEPLLPKSQTQSEEDDTPKITCDAKHPTANNVCNKCAVANEVSDPCEKKKREKSPPRKDSCQESSASNEICKKISQIQELCEKKSQSKCQKMNESNDACKKISEIPKALCEKESKPPKNKCQKTNESNEVCEKISEIPRALFKKKSEPPKNECQKTNETDEVCKKISQIPKALCEKESKPPKNECQKTNETDEVCKKISEIPRALCEKESEPPKNECQKTNESDEVCKKISEIPKALCEKESKPPKNKCQKTNESDDVCKKVSDIPKALCEKESKPPKNKCQKTSESYEVCKKVSETPPKALCAKKSATKPKKTSAPPTKSICGKKARDEKSKKPEKRKKTSPPPPENACEKKIGPPKNVCSKKSIPEKKKSTTVCGIKPKPKKKVCDKKAAPTDDTSKKTPANLPSVRVYDKKPDPLKTCKEIRRKNDIAKEMCDKEPESSKKVCDKTSEQMPLQSTCKPISCDKEPKPSKKVCDKTSEQMPLQSTCKPISCDEEPKPSKKVCDKTSEQMPLQSTCKPISCDKEPKPSKKVCEKTSEQMPLKSTCKPISCDKEPKPSKKVCEKTSEQMPLKSTCKPISCDKEPKRSKNVCDDEITVVCKKEPELPKNTCKPKAESSKKSNRPTRPKLKEPCKPTRVPLSKEEEDKIKRDVRKKLYDALNNIQITGRTEKTTKEPSLKEKRGKKDGCSPKQDSESKNKSCSQERRKQSTCSTENKHKSEDKSKKTEGKKDGNNAIKKCKDIKASKKSEDSDKKHSQSTTCVLESKDEKKATVKKSQSAPNVCQQKTEKPIQKEGDKRKPTFQSDRCKKKNEKNKHAGPKKCVKKKCATPKKSAKCEKKVKQKKKSDTAKKSDCSGNKNKNKCPRPKRSEKCDKLAEDKKNQKTRDPKSGGKGGGNESPPSPPTPACPPRPICLPKHVCSADTTTKMMAMDEKELCSGASEILNTMDHPANFNTARVDSTTLILEVQKQIVARNSLEHIDSQNQRNVHVADITKSEHHIKYPKQMSETQRATNMPGLLNSEGKKDETFICKIEKASENFLGKPLRTFKCRLVKDEFGREVFVCEDDLGNNLNLENKDRRATKSSTLLPTPSDTTAKTNPPFPESGMHDFNHPIIGGQSKNNDNYLKTLRITKKILENDKSKMENLLIKYNRDKNVDKETKQRIFRIYNSTKDLLQRYYLVEDDKENDLLGFDYKDIVLRQQMLQHKDNIITMNYKT